MLEHHCSNIGFSDTFFAETDQRAHLDTTTGARAVPARSTSLGRGILDNSRVFTPDKPLRTGTVRGPAGRYPDSPRINLIGA